MNRMKKTNFFRKLCFLLSMAAAACCIFYALSFSAVATGVFRPFETHDFRSDSETVYSAARSAAVLTAGTSQWKLTEPGEAKKNRNGLFVPSGILSLYKNNPLNSMTDFQMELRYSTSCEDGEADGATAFFYMSSQLYGKSLLLSDPNVLVSVAENGDVYVCGEKINHSGLSPAEDILTAKNPMIGADDECVLTVTYAKGSLSVLLSCHGMKRELVRQYACEIAGLRQMQLGGDKTAGKRIGNMTYKTITFSEYEENEGGNGEGEDRQEEEYTPADGVKAIVRTGETFVEYTSGQSAFDAVCANTKPGVQVILYSDVILTKPVKLAKNATFLLDLNGFAVDRNRKGKKASDGYVFFLDEYSSLTVMDSSPKRQNYAKAIPGGVITGGAGDDVGGCFQMKKGARLTMEGGSVVNCVTNDHGGAIRIAGSGVRVTLVRVGFYCNMTCDSTDNCHGGAIYEDYDDCVISADHCIFEGNYSEDCGGAVYVNDGQFLAYACFFSDNASHDDGGAVYIDSGAYALLDECVFQLNQASGAGGAVYCNSSEGTRLSGEYQYNTAEKSGGAIYVCGDSVSISDAEIRNNRAGAHGGGVYVDELYDVSVKGLLRIRDNSTSQNQRENLYLDDFGLTEAKIWCGGLDAGSEVWVRTGDSEHTISENISEYQKKYFWQDDSAKSFFFTETESKKENMRLITSAIGSGDLIFLIVSLAVTLAVIQIFAAWEKRKKGDKPKDHEK